MFTRRAILCSLICLSIAESKKSYILKSTSSWNNEIKKCASGGEDSRTYSFDIGNLQSLGLNYTDIDELTTMIAFGFVSGSSKASYQELELLLLHKYEEGSGFKQFTGDWKYEAVCGWAKQRCGTSLTVKVASGGNVQLKNWVTAASWGAVTCAETKVYIKRVQIIN